MCDSDAFRTNVSYIYFSQVKEEEEEEEAEGKRGEVVGARVSMLYDEAC